MKKFFSLLQFLKYFVGLVAAAPLSQFLFEKRQKEGVDVTCSRRPSDALILHALIFKSAGKQPKQLYQSQRQATNNMAPFIKERCSELYETGIASLGQVSAPQVAAVKNDLRHLKSQNYSCEQFKTSLQSGQYNEPTFFYKSRELIKLDSILTLKEDMRCDDIAAGYFGDDFKFLSVNAWNTLPSYYADNRSAQQYHFDLDSGWFIKFFCYLTDVGQNNGPFTYVPQSHNQKPRSLLSGLRIKDAAIQKHYGDQQIHMLGDAGCSFVADTQGLHKGQNVFEGQRTLVQFLYVKEEFATNPSAFMQ